MERGDTQRGFFIVLEGTDGAGKGTQFKLLAKQLRQAGHDVAVFDFPQYDQPSSYFVKRYLNGEYGAADKVGPYTGSLFYALDRYDAAPAIREALEAGKVVLANRFTASNMGHQGAKFNNTEQRRGFFIWLDNLEFETLGIPRPDLNIVLRVPATIAQQLIDQKEDRGYTDKKRDLHEADLAHLEKAVEVYDDLCQLFPKDFSRIDCARGGRLLNREAIHTLIREKVEPLLPKPVAGRRTDPAATLTVTKPTTSQPADRGVHKAGSNEPRRTGLQLTHASIAIEVEHASSLLLQKLEQGRSISYAEQRRRTDYDKKGKESEYDYYTPEHLDESTLLAYKQAMDSIFNRYTTIVRKLTHYVREHSDTPDNKRNTAWKRATRAQACNAASAVLPVAARSTITIHATTQAPEALESLVIRLLADDLPEARNAGAHIFQETRKTTPSFLKHANNPDYSNIIATRLSDTRSSVRQLADKHLPNSHTPANQDNVTLTEVWPRNELEIVADILYEHSDMPLQAIRDEVSTWAYEQKSRVLQTYVGDYADHRQPPGRALEKIRYNWDLVSDYRVFRTFQRRHVVDGLEWQQPTPRHGYETPQLIDDAGLSDLFDDCFDISLQLYSHLQQHGYVTEAHYAILLGHKLRWKMAYDAREAFHILGNRANIRGQSEYGSLLRRMHEKIASAHPLLGESM